ncbi:DUF3139 domain-containing protein [Bacillus weihaiensis]|nr:DUF3139 domain-containing protein [Bacillus weihaiensis]
MIIMVPSLIFGYVKYKLHSLEEQTYAYLLKEYKEEDILKVKANIQKGTLFIANVTFKDEPNYVYDYADIEER